MPKQVFLTSVRNIVTFPFRAIWWLFQQPFRLIQRFYRFLNVTPEENQLTDVFSVSVQKPALLLDHLNDLRKHLFRILIAIIVCVAVLFAFTPDLVNFLALPIGGLAALTAIDVTESVGVFMRVALMGAMVAASPYIAFELWLFAAPGLMPRARKLGLLGIPLVLVFFVSGIAFVYKFLLPTALPFLLNFMGIKALPRVSSYINFVTGIMFWIGLAFEFPLVVYILTVMGILQPGSLVKQWRVAVVIIAIAAAVITPTPDPINMSIVMTPLIILYLIGIGLSFLAAIGRRKKTVSGLKEPQNQ